MASLEINRLLRVLTLAVGRFAAPPGHEDSQQPHSEDESDFVTAGKPT